MSDNEEELMGSELGTFDYWENRYQKEIENFRDYGDTGDVWFGEDAEVRICKWIQKSPRVHKNSTIIDIGCGNGMLLIELSKRGYIDLLGIDYSHSAVVLAREIAEKYHYSIKYEVQNILEEDRSMTDKFDVVHDKGTYDAISLDPENPKEKRLAYIENVHSILKSDGILLITSCNWTECELIDHFENKFSVLEVIPTPQFKFGGKVGNLVSSVAFVKI